MSIGSSYLKLRGEIPDYVKMVLAAKTRSADEIKEAILAGADIIGENYVQEAERVYSELGALAEKVKWHFIGTLQKNKINKALKIFDCFETVDSTELARALNDRAGKAGKIVSVFVEINIGSEITKSGVKPEYEAVEELVKDISGLSRLRLEGLMTMGPRTGSPDDLRGYFRKTKEIFGMLKRLNLPNVDLKYISMGMSNSYKVAIEEGSNMVRLGTAVFGRRSCDLTG
ncbi:MAG: YggS family pyridoxal phosphate enzyme [Candidatus Omnitrophica bacterium 4484_171]|nr:MAG: YggS family pyridoxal phosphate enzyme [Candidatus Omnitrophica bacterium 4484_171]